MENEFLRLPAVLARYGGISQSTVYQLIKDGRFPRPIHIGRSSLWSAQALAEHEVILAAAVSGGPIPDGVEK